MIGKSKMNKKSGQPLLSNMNQSPISFFITILILWGMILGCWFTEAIASQKENRLLDQPGGFSKGFEHRMVAEILAQLRNKSRAIGDLETYTLIQKVRIRVPNKSLVEKFPNAYAFSNKQAHWVFIERGWMKQVAGFSELGALLSLAYFGNLFDKFSQQTFKNFCNQYKASFRKAVLREIPGAVVYKFSLENFHSRSNSRFATLYPLYDKLAGLVLANTITWAVLHEVGHHVLKHTRTAAGSYHESRQNELKADVWAFSYMKKLGYSLFGLGGFMDARVWTEKCLSDLGLIDDEKKSTHPSWQNRNKALRQKFDVLAAPNQDPRIFYFQMEIPQHPELSTMVIPDSSSDQMTTVLIQIGQRIIGMTEWEGKTARVFFRERTTGGRIEIIIKDAMLMVQTVKGLMFNSENLLIKKKPILAIQSDTASLEFLKLKGMKLSDLRKRFKGKKLIAVHLRRVGVLESKIPKVLASADQCEKSRNSFALQFVKGEIDQLTFSNQTIKNSRKCGQRLIAILGGKSFQAFKDSYKSEINSILPPSTGLDTWEENFLKDNFGER